MRIKIVTSPRQLRKEIARLDRSVTQGCVGAMRETAQFGLTAVARTQARVRPRPLATGQYKQSWGVKRLRNGAVMGSSARQSLWVEAGRKPGKRPPLAPILEWVRVKKLAGKKGAKRRKRPQKRDKGGRFVKGAARAAAERALAFAIQAKIGRKGTPARWPLKTAMEPIGRRAYRELRRAVQRALKD